MEEKEEEDGDKPSIISQFFSSLGDLIKHPVTRWTTMGAMSRYLNSFLTDFYLPFYFLRTYTGYTGVFASVYSLMLVFCSVFSGLVGGYVCDKFG